MKTKKKKNDEKKKLTKKLTCFVISDSTPAHAQGIEITSSRKSPIEINSISNFIISLFHCRCLSVSHSCSALFLNACLCIGMNMVAVLNSYSNEDE